METKKTTSLTYRDAGVDIKAGDALVRAIGPVAERTRRPGLMGTIGGFGGLFDLKEAGFKDPVLVSATDGVGTKLILSQKLGRHRGLGIDLVAMCVNDLLAQGAEPLFFLDYFATGRLHPSIAEQVIEGIADGCVLAGCALIGGETAEMPGVYDDGVYDLAGFAVGAAEREDILPKSDIQPGDILLGLPSSGLHSNGFALVRKVVADNALDLSGPCPYASQSTLGDSLLTPTRIYVKPLLGPIRAGKVKALAHITGGGLTDNIPRVLPKTCAAAIDLGRWEAPGVFAWLSKTAGIEETEMLHTFNCGIGMVIVARRDAVALLRSSLADKGEQVIEIGSIIAAEPNKPDRIVYSERLF